MSYCFSKKVDMTFGEAISNVTKALEKEARQQNL